MKLQSLKYIVLPATFFLAINGSVSANWPCYRGYIEIEPFYAKATDSLLSNSIFAVKVADPGILGDFKQEYPLDIDKSLGARIAVGYTFPNCGRKVYGLSLEYTFLNTDNDSNLQNNDRNIADKPVLAPAEFIDITDEAAARFSSASSKFDQHFATLDLLAHRFCRMNCYSRVNVFAGIRYFHLNEHLHNHYNFADFIEDVFVTNIYDVNFKNETDQIGPHVGAALTYPVYCGLSLTGQITGSLLYGESHSRFNNFYSLSPDSTLGETTLLSSFNHHENSAHFTPALSGKVGLSYQTCFNRCSTWVFEVGYRGERFFNAINDVAFQQLLTGDDVNSNSNYQDFDLSGPYAAVTVKL